MRNPGCQCAVCLGSIDMQPTKCKNIKVVKQSGQRNEFAGDINHVIMGGQYFASLFVSFFKHINNTSNLICNAYTFIT